jgi:hypothetical protein
MATQVSSVGGWDCENRKEHEKEKIMNAILGEVGNGWAQSVTQRQVSKRFAVGLTGMALATIVFSSAAQVRPLGPLVELSQPNPVGTCDDGFRLQGTITINDATEPAIAVNPVNPNNIVASWIQGPIQNIIAAVSLDGGRSWQQVPIPLTLCSGGQFVGAGDPWLSFAPNGDLYAVNLAGPTLPARGAFVNKSSDGGLHWSVPVMVPATTNTLPDHPTITADRTDARFAYAAWHSSADKSQIPAVFTRTTDGGLTWEPARIIFQPAPHNFVDINQIFVLADGTLVDLFIAYYEPGPKQPPKTQNIAVLRSTDKGQTWSAPVYGPAVTPTFQPNGSNGTIDPETGQFLHDPGDPAFAQDTHSGALYAVWEDARFSSFQYNDIVFSMSMDGGLSWSNPIRVNQTPLNIPPQNRQAFLPSVAVRSDGTIGVSYYDFRFNDPNPGLPTDYWMVQCKPSATTPATAPANWGNEVRLTSSSFDFESVVLFDETFLGDYVGGLVSSGKGFVAAFTAVDQNKFTSIFGRRIGP